MGRKFKTLKAVINAFAAKGISTPAEMTGTALEPYRKYLEWTQDETKRRRPDGATPAKGRNVKVGIKAFGLAAVEDAGDEVIIKVNNRVYTIVPASGGTVGNHALMGWTVAAAGAALPSTFTPKAGFKAAKAIIAPLLANAVSEISDITGRPYKRNSENSYTVPFGKAGTKKSEFEQQDAILLAVTGASITFTPERLRRGL